MLNTAPKRALNTPQTKSRIDNKGLLQPLRPQQPLQWHVYAIQHGSTLLPVLSVLRSSMKGGLESGNTLHRTREVSLCIPVVMCQSETTVLPLYNMKK